MANNKGPRSRSSMWEENGKKKAKTRGLGWGQFNGATNEVNSSNSNTEKKNVRNKEGNAQSNSHHLVPCALPSPDCLCPAQLLPSEHSMAAHGIEKTVLFDQFVLAAHLCPLLDSGEN